MTTIGKNSTPYFVRFTATDNYPNLETMRDLHVTEDGSYFACVRIIPGYTTLTKETVRKILSLAYNVRLSDIDPTVAHMVEDGRPGEIVAEWEPVVA